MSSRASMMRWIWITAALALAPGCGKDKKDADLGPSCEKVADHVAEVARKAYPGHAEMMPASARKAYVASCESRNLSAQQRRCMLKADTMDGLARCVPRDKSDEPKPDGRLGVPATPPAPAGDPPGGPAPAAPPAAPAPPPPSPR